MELEAKGPSRRQATYSKGPRRTGDKLLIHPESTQEFELEGNHLQQRLHLHPRGRRGDDLPTARNHSPSRRLEIYQAHLQSRPKREQRPKVALK